MPKFRQIPIAEQKARRKGVPPETVEQYKAYIRELRKDNVGLLEFGKTESIELGRRALAQASEELRKYVKVRRKRGENALQFSQVTQKEWQDRQRKARARAGKATRTRSGK